MLRETDKFFPGHETIQWLNPAYINGVEGSPAWWRDRCAQVIDTPPTFPAERFDYNSATGTWSVVGAGPWIKIDDPQLGEFPESFNPSDLDLFANTPAWAEYLQDDENFIQRVTRGGINYDYKLTSFAGPILDYTDEETEPAPFEPEVKEGMKWLKGLAAGGSVSMTRRIISLLEMSQGVMGDGTIEGMGGYTGIRLMKFDAVATSLLRHDAIGRSNWRSDLASSYFCELNWPRIFAPWWVNRVAINTHPIQYLGSVMWRLERSIPYFDDATDPLKNEWDWIRVGQRDYTARTHAQFCFQRWRGLDGGPIVSTWGWLPWAHNRYRSEWYAAQKRVTANHALLLYRRFLMFRQAMSLDNLMRSTHGLASPWAGVAPYPHYFRKENSVSRKKAIDAWMAKGEL
jgi:hypothetical protein